MFSKCSSMLSIPFLLLCTATPCLSIRVMGFPDTRTGGHYGHPLFATRVIYAPDDSVTVTLYPYYDFIQYYDSSRVVMRFGEVDVHRQTGVIEDHSLLYHDENNAPLYKNALDDLRLLSGSLPFMNIEGDTVSYYWSLLQSPEYNSSSDAIYIPDTLIYYLDVVSAYRDTILCTIDSLGTYPHNFRWQYLASFVSSPDTAIIKKWVINSMPDSIASLRLQIRPTFRGNMDRLSISRWDFVVEKKASEYDIYYKAIMADSFLAILDSLIAVYSIQPKAGTREPGREHPQFRVAIRSTAKGALEAAITGTIGDEVCVNIYNNVGRKIVEHSYTQSTAEYPLVIDMARHPAGSYYVVVTVKGEIVCAAKYSIVR
jgi:hypothetical protein